MPGQIGLSGTAILTILVFGQIAAIAITGTNSALHDLLAGTVTVDISSQRIFKDSQSLLDYQKKMYVVAQDLDWKGVYMCYLQLSLLGIKAVCIQGNTLEKLDVLKNVNKRNILRTPAEVGLML